MGVRVLTRRGRLAGKSETKRGREGIVCTEELPGIRSWNWSK